MHEVVLRSTADACALVDELGPGAIGSIEVGSLSEPTGTVFVEGGRVCWAAARGMSRRLTEILGEIAMVTSGEMEALFRSCKAKHTPLGEHLVERGVLRAEDFREALLRHTVESLRRLCSADAAGRWMPRSSGSYCPRFTFSTTELLAEVGAFSHGALGESAAALLAEQFTDALWSAAFTRDPTCAYPMPVAVRGVPPSTATAVLRIGRWAATAIDMARAYADGEPFVCVERASRDEPRSLIAFHQENLVLAGESGAHGTARILNRRAARRRRADHGVV